MLDAPTVAAIGSLPVIGQLPAVCFLLLSVAFGDVLASRFLQHRSTSERLASAFLVGLLISTWMSYLAAAAFASAFEQPLLAGDATVALLMAVAVLGARGVGWPSNVRRIFATPPDATVPPDGAVSPNGAAPPDTADRARPAAPADHSERTEWLVLTALGLFVAWMAHTTYQTSEGQFWIGEHVWSDFGPTSAIAQSFALGHNFPTEYPHFANAPIIYHFLFYFGVGNLTFLGFDPALANNVLFVLSIVSLLAIVIALGKRLFGSSVVGWVGAGLFLFHGTLSFIPYLEKFGSPAEALAAIAGNKQFLSSGFPYRGEEWGIWTQTVFLNQRHLASAMGIVLIVVLFVVDRLLDPRAAAEAVSPQAVAPDVALETSPSRAAPRFALDRLPEGPRSVLVGLRAVTIPGLWGYLFCGVLLGLLPLWNGAIFVASGAVLAAILVIFPNRLGMLALACAAAAVAAPQLVAVRPASLDATLFSPTFHWGYVVDDPTPINVIAYLGFTFGPKLALAGVALAGSSSFRARFLLAVSSLVGLAFLLQLSPEVLANHKFLNLWLIVLNLYAAAGLVRLWRITLPRLSRLFVRFAGRVVAVALAGMIVVGGAIDLMPLTHEGRLGFRLGSDPLGVWLRDDTGRTDVFLTDLYVAHPILLAGRRIFYGWPYYAWSAGYPTVEREQVYKRMLQERDPRVLLDLLQANRISWVAIDDGLRAEPLAKNLNEDVYRANFELAFGEPGGDYGHLAIFRVPPGAPGRSSGAGADQPGSSPAATTQAEPTVATGGPTAASGGPASMPPILALAYLLLMLICGERIGRILRPSGAPERLAIGFLVGLLLSSWLSFLAAMAVRGDALPLVRGDLIAAGAMLFVLASGVVWRWRRSRVRPPGTSGGSAPSEPDAAPAGNWARWNRWDWILLAIFAVFVSWMMTRTLGYAEGVLRTGNNEWGDLAPNLAIVQSFAVGRNLPPEYPLFSGEPILFHFLFYFGAGNLTFLGLDPALAVNVLSIGSMLAMLVLVMVLGRTVFRSAAVGRIAALLFFLHGSLSFIPFLGSFPSPEAAISAVLGLDHYLSSGLPFRGEDWALWSQNVFLNQRHLASAIGIVLLVLVFVVRGIDGRVRASEPAAADAGDRVADAVRSMRRIAGSVRGGLSDPNLPGYLLSGALLGAMPLWNSPLFVASAILLGALLVLTRLRVQLVALGLTAAAISIPQLLYMKSPSATGSQAYPTFHLGFTIDPPTIANVGLWLALIFGAKLVLGFIAVMFGTAMQRRVFAAIAMLVVVVLTVQLSVDVVGAHKLLNLWLVLLNVFAAGGLVLLWQRRSTLPRRRLRAGAARIAAVVIAGAIVTGGVIDLVPIKNDDIGEVRLSGDRLYDWLVKKTAGDDVFLSDLYIGHRITFAGRRLYLGWPVYPWSAGYDTETRFASWRRLLQIQRPGELVKGLQDNGIAFVAIDDGVRSNRDLPALNEAVLREQLELVFDDPDGQYAHLAIYRVPTDPNAWRSLPGQPIGELFTGPTGAKGVIGSARGIAVSPNGEILVADAGKHQIVRFSQNGDLISVLGSEGSTPGQFKEPNGVGVDSRGHIFVADTWNSRLQEFDAEGVFVREWSGPDPGFYGPRDIAIGPDDSVYILDVGHARVVRLAKDGSASAFGEHGSDDGQLQEPTGLTVVGDLVVVADPSNRRIEVFETSGTFVRSIAMPDWSPPQIYPDVVASPDLRRLFASIPALNRVIELGIDGTVMATLTPELEGLLSVPSSLAFDASGRLLVVDLGADRVSVLSPPAQ